MSETATVEPLAPTPPEEINRAIHAHCERAQRRLRVLARERNDVLLAQALRSVKTAKALSAAQLRSS